LVAFVFVVHITALLFRSEPPAEPLELEVVLTPLQYKKMSVAGSSATGSLGHPAQATGAAGMLGEREVVRNTGKQAIVSFLESQTCYSVLRASGKVVVFDTRIPIQLAFYALVEHGE
jgi:hypothetical protein